MTDVLIIGAGAAGLMAGRELTRKKYSVIILEARDRIGGRIHTMYHDEFKCSLETGAEFIHGNLPVTKSLLKQSQSVSTRIAWNAWQSENGILIQSDFFMEEWKEFRRQLKKLKHDIPVNTFLDKYFSKEKHASLRKRIRGFVEGYDAADPQRASTFALRDEWMTDGDQQQYRVKGGYMRLMEFLYHEIRRDGNEIHLSSIAESIQWAPHDVRVLTTRGAELKARKVLITVPLGVLIEQASTVGTIRFTPSLPEKNEATMKMGYGHVIKIFFLFTKPFWKDYSIVKTKSKRPEKMSFLFAEAPVPTWWTQYPEESTLLTGWLSGTAARRYQTLSNEELSAMGLQSLSAAFNLPVEVVKGLLMHHILPTGVPIPFHKVHTLTQLLISTNREEF